jgi:hypothetical protein
MIGTSYIYAHTYREAGDFGLSAINASTLSEISHKSYANDKITDFFVYSDSRIVTRSDNNLSVMSFDGTSFSTLCSIDIQSSLITGVTCNNNFAFVSTGDRIISLSISTGNIAQEYNMKNSYRAYNLVASGDYLFVRKSDLYFHGHKLGVYRITTEGFLVNPADVGSVQEVEVASPAFDTDLGRLSVDSSFNIIETGLHVNRLVTFNGSGLTVVGELTPFYPALEFVKHGTYYFISPDLDMRVLSRSGLVFTELYSSSTPTRFATYKCPGFVADEFFMTRDIQNDVYGRSISRNLIVP